MRLVLILVAALAVIAGCGSGEADVSDSLTQTWVTEGGYFIVFRDDGSYGVASAAPPGDAASADVEWGTWSIEESVLSMVPDATSPNCAGITGAYEVELSDDRLEATVQDDECGVRSNDFSSGLTLADAGS